jgi:Cys-tRNA synthase (O-phospho-L-seryl-tRNA:Cys-tRNA synthase)
MGRNGRASKGIIGDIKKYQEGWLGHLNGCYQQQKKKKKRLKFFFFEEFANGQVMGIMDWMMRSIMVDVGGTKKDLKYIQGKFEPFFGPKN